MKNVFLSTMAAVLLSACASMGGMSDVQKVEVACSSATAALKVLDIARAEGKLSLQAQSQVMGAIDILRPVCAADEAPSMSDVEKQAMDAAVALIAELALESKNGR